MKKQKSALSNNSTNLSKKDSIKSNKKNRDGATGEKGEELKNAGPQDTNMNKKVSKKDKTNYNSRGGTQPQHDNAGSYNGGGGNQGGGYYGNGGNQGYDGAGDKNSGGYYR